MSRSQLDEILALLEVGEYPEETRPILREVLAGDDASRKMRALELTAELIDEDRLAELHLEIIEDDGEPEEVRALAAIALGPTIERCGWGSWNDPYDPPPVSRACFNTLQRRLERVYRTAEVPRLVRRRVLEASVRAPQEWHRGAIRAAWNGDDEGWRRTAVFGMGEVNGFEETIGEALTVDDKEIVCEAMRAAAGRDGVPGAAETFMTYARDASQCSECRLAAIEGLRFVDATEAYQLLDALTQSDNDDIAGTAAWALDEWSIFHGVGGM